MRVLGLSAYAHDAGVAIVEDGRPTIAVDTAAEAIAWPCSLVSFLLTDALDDPR